MKVYLIGIFKTLKASIVAWIFFKSAIVFKRLFCHSKLLLEKSIIIYLNTRHRLFNNFNIFIYIIFIIFHRNKNIWTRNNHRAKALWLSSYTLFINWYKHYNIASITNCRLISGLPLISILIKLQRVSAVKSSSMIS